MNNDEMAEIGFLMIKLKQMQEKGKQGRMHSTRNRKKCEK